MKAKDILHKSELAVALRDHIWDTYLKLLKNKKLSTDELDDQKGQLLNAVKKAIKEYQ